MYAEFQFNISPKDEPFSFLHDAMNANLFSLRSKMIFINEWKRDYELINAFLPANFNLDVE